MKLTKIIFNINSNESDYMDIDSLTSDNILDIFSYEYRDMSNEIMEQLRKLYGGYPIDQIFKISNLSYRNDGSIYIPIPEDDLDLDVQFIEDLLSDVGINDYDWNRNHLIIGDYDLMVNAFTIKKVKKSLVDKLKSEFGENYDEDKDFDTRAYDNSKVEKTFNDFVVEGNSKFRNFLEHIANYI